jgi:hypothetical protein
MAEGEELRSNLLRLCPMHDICEIGTLDNSQTGTPGRKARRARRADRKYS